MMLYNCNCTTVCRQQYKWTHRNQRQSTKKWSILTL